MKMVNLLLLFLEPLRAEVQETRNPLSEDNFCELVQRMDPLSSSESYGADIYLSIVSFISKSAALSN